MLNRMSLMATFATYAYGATRTTNITQTNLSRTNVGNYQMKISNITLKKEP